ncbi:MAG: hypothetical protein ACFFB2_14390 [Promethearchaeota archaeon]
MTDSKEIETLKADLVLVAKTAKALADKLEKVALKFDEIFTSINSVKVPQSAPKVVEVAKSTPAPTPAPKPAPTPSVHAVGIGEETKAGRLLDSFLSQVQTLSKGKEISDLLSRLRDQVMQSAEVGFHPAFHEMGRYANQIKNIREISAAEKEQLIEKIYDWKARLTG